MIPSFVLEHAIPAGHGLREHLAFAPAAREVNDYVFRDLL